MKPKKFQLTDKQQKEINIIKENLKNYYNNYDLSFYEPFYHGTSTWHYEQIKEKGLLPRKHSKLKEIAEKNTSLGSKENQIYLMDKYRNPLASEDYGRIATRLAKNINKKNKNIRPLILKIKNINQYKDFINEDTEDNTFDSDISSFYDDKIGKGWDDCYYYKSMDRNVIDLMDVIWVKYGYEGIQQITNIIPPHIKSLYSIDQLTVTKPINKNDIELAYTIKEFDKHTDDINNNIKSLIKTEKYGCSKNDNEYTQKFINTDEKQQKNLIINRKKEILKKKLPKIKKLFMEKKNNER